MQLRNAFDADGYPSRCTDETNRYLLPVAARTFLATLVISW